MGEEALIEVLKEFANEFSGLQHESPKLLSNSRTSETVT